MPEVIDDIGRPVVEYIDPTGISWPLTDNSDDVGWFTSNGPAGWGAPQFEFVIDNMPGGGQSVREVQQQEMRLVWPMHVWGETHLHFVSRIRTIRSALIMTSVRKQPGILRITRPDGTARQCRVMYESGLEGRAGEDWKFANPPITLFLPDGCWTDVDDVQVTQDFQPGVSWFSPFRTVSPPGVGGDLTIDNNGDMPAFPMWTVSGPMSQLTATTYTTGYAFTVTYPLLAGEQMTLTSKPQTVLGPGAANLGDFVNWPAARIWRLEPGENNVSFAMQDAAAGSAVTLSYKRRYGGA